MDRNEEGKGTGMKRINGQERRREIYSQDEARGQEIGEKICGQWDLKWFLSYLVPNCLAAPAAVDLTQYCRQKRVFQFFVPKIRLIFYHCTKVIIWGVATCIWLCSLQVSLTFSPATFFGYAVYARGFAAQYI